MAPRKNTQGSNDSLTGGTPDQAGERTGAASQMTGAQPDGNGDAGDVGAGAVEYSASPAKEADRAALMQAIASIGPNLAPILPKGTAPEFLPERRIATVVSAIEHDGYRFAPGDPIPLSLSEFTGLKGTGALAGASWDDLETL